MTAIKTAQVILNHDDVRKAIALYIGRELDLDRPACPPEMVKIMYFHDGMQKWSEDDCKLRVEMTVHI